MPLAPKKSARLEGTKVGFWGSMFGGSNPTLNQGINKAGQVSGYGTSVGEGLTTSAGNFFKGILGGDPAQTAKLLSPQIQAAQERGQQAKQTASQFGNRSGGTNARAQTIDDQTRSGITSMIANLTSAAATSAADLGKNLIDTGITALNQQVQFSQQQMENWGNSLFGLGMTKAVGAGMNFLTGGAGG